jgi:carbonic anhydrase
VLEQVVNVCQTRSSGRLGSAASNLTVHGWIYGLKDGLMHDLGITVDCPARSAPRYDAALKALDA